MSITSGGQKGEIGSDNRPLSDTEFQQVQRLFSDPFSFPIEFKTWLVAYIEGSDITLPMTAINGLNNAINPPSS